MFGDTAHLKVKKMQNFEPRQCFALLLVVELQDITDKEGAPNPAAQGASSLSAGGRSHRV